MNRLFRISLDILLTSIVPIAGWFLLGIILDKNLVNIFTLTYPLQFIMTALKSVFATGANISYYKDKNKYAIDSGIILGVLIGATIFGIVIFNIDNYINFMNMDVATYKTFAIYSIIQIYLQLILNLILSKLYYKNKNKIANTLSLQFNLINFVTLIISAIVTRNQKLTAIISILFLAIYTVFILFKSIDKFTIKINILNCIKYDSVDFFSKINFIIIYLFGLSNAFNFGEMYMLAISFETLVTDMQWDIALAINNVAKIDISRKKFNYKMHLKNGFRLVSILVASILFMTILLFNSYDLDIKVISIFLGVEILSLLLYPLYAIKDCYLQLEYSALKTTINKQIANILRTLASFIYTPYCTIIGLAASVMYQILYTQILWIKSKRKKLIKKRV